MLTRPLLIGRGPWAQKVYAAMPRGVFPTITGAITAEDCIKEARNRGNDSFIIASRTDSHFELLKLALPMKLPIFCEKPMTMSYGDAQWVEQIWETVGRPPFMCNFVHLYTAGFGYVWPRFMSK